MNKKNIAVIAIIAVILIAGGLLINRYYFLDNNRVIDKLLTINGTVELTDAQLSVIEESRKILNEDPNNYQALLDVAVLKQAAGDIDGAIAMYENLMELRPKDIMIYNNLGTIYYNRGEYEKSEEMYLYILDNITYKWINSYNELLNIYQYHLTDKKDKFEKYIIDGVEKYEEMKPVLASKAAVYFDDVMNDKVNAIKYYELTVELNSNNITAKNRLAELKK